MADESKHRVGETFSEVVVLFPLVFLAIQILEIAVNVLSKRSEQ